MAMPKRLSGSRKVVSIIDPALEKVPRLKTKMVGGREVPHMGMELYGTTLDTTYLGDLKELGATVFEIMPLKSSLMNWDKGDDSPFFQIFQYHVVGIENFPAEPPLTFKEVGGYDYKILTDESMKQIPLSFIRDIGNMVLQLAKCDGVTLPFSMLDSSQEISNRSRVARSMRIFPAVTVDVKTSASDGEKSTD